MSIKKQSEEEDMSEVMAGYDSARRAVKTAFNPDLKLSPPGDHMPDMSAGIAVKQAFSGSGRSRMQRERACENREGLLLKSSMC
ncbi:MAG: hypothetical protein JXM72_04955 [Deltaproteobacteria bacterium]|nr:hypothetical protein [Deltaproteobacteria bacterium]